MICLKFGCYFVKCSSKAHDYPLKSEKNAVFQHCGGFSKSPDPHFPSLPSQSSPSGGILAVGEYVDVKSVKLKIEHDVTQRISRLPEHNTWCYSNYH